MFMPWKTGDPVPKDAIQAGYDPKVGELYIGRGPFGPHHGCIGSIGTTTGKRDGALNVMKCSAREGFFAEMVGRPGGFTLDYGEILVGQHCRVSWAPIWKGQRLPPTAFRAGLQKGDGCLYIARTGYNGSVDKPSDVDRPGDVEKMGTVGKLTTKDMKGEIMEGLWCFPKGMVETSEEEKASVLCIDPCKPISCGARYRHVKTVLAHCTEKVTLASGTHDRMSNSQAFLHDISTGTTNYSQLDMSAAGGEQGGVSGLLGMGAGGGAGVSAAAGGSAGVKGGAEAGASAGASAEAAVGIIAKLAANAGAEASASAGGGFLSLFGAPKMSAGAHADAHLDTAAGAGASAAAQLGGQVKAGIGVFAQAFLKTAAQAAVSAFAQGNVAGQFAQFFNVAAGAMSGNKTTKDTKDVTKTVKEQVHDAWSTQSSTVILSNTSWLFGNFSMQVWQLDLHVGFDDGSEMVMPTTHYTTSYGRSAPSVHDSMLEQFGIPLKSNFQKFGARLQGLCAC